MLYLLPSIHAHLACRERPPEREAVADPAAAIRVDALDRLFAKQLARPAEGESEGGAASPQRSRGMGAAPQAGTAAEGDADSSCGSPGRLASQGSLSLGAGGRGKRPVIRFFTAGRKAVNLEIVLRQLGSPADVAQAIAELDTCKLRVSWAGRAPGPPHLASQLLLPIKPFQTCRPGCCCCGCESTRVPSAVPWHPVLPL